MTNLRVDMKKRNPVVEKSFEYSKKAVKLSDMLKKESKEYELASQLLRSATSVGANVSEAQYAQSKKDFVSKMSIARKEANESKYWLKLLSETGIVEPEMTKDLLKRRV